MAFAGNLYLIDSTTVIEASAGVGIAIRVVMAETTARRSSNRRPTSILLPAVALRASTMWSLLRSKGIRGLSCGNDAGELRQVLPHT